MKTYGLPYKGSKDKIAEKICSLFPIRENFYDLFMGGGSITHYQLLQNQYKNYYANDFDSLVVKAFDMAIHGEFKNETRWISHEEFNKLRFKDAYATLCFSFGNNKRSYAYCEEKEKIKKALHYAILFDDYSLLKEYVKDNIDFKELSKIKDLTKKRLWLQHKLTNLGYDGRLRNLENYESVKQLEHLQRLESVKQLTLTSKSYDEIKIKPNSIIYCDIPYHSSEIYRCDETYKFDYEKFYSWCERQTELCFISEYSMPKDRFTCIAEIEHRSIICANENQSVIERVFLPNHQAKDYKIPSLFDM